MSYPKVKIRDYQPHNNKFYCGDDTWDVPTLVAYWKEKDYKPFDLPLAAIDLSNIPWTIENVKDLLFEIQRIQNVSYDEPIILDDKGYVCDGWHRIVKAILDGKETIKAVRLNEMPTPNKQ